MKKIALLLLLAASPLSAWENAGLSIQHSEEAEEHTILTLLDDQDLIIYVHQSVDPDEADIQRILSTRRTIMGWRQLRIREFRVYILEGSIQFQVLPESFVYKNQDMAAFMPAGMMFFFDREELLQYSFRMLKDNVSMKLEGRFINLEEFCLQLDYAVRHPLAFADKTNYMARLDKLDYETQMLRLQYYDMIDSNVQQQQEIHTLRQAVLYWENSRHFSDLPSPIAPTLISRIYMLRTRNSSLSALDIQKALKAEGISIAQSEVQLVLDALFNEWRSATARQTY